jgi:alcohol dehydrogenase class IV
MAEVMRISEHTDSAFIARIEEILDEIGIPKSLADMGVPLSCAERIAGKALLDSAASTNPQKADVSEMRQLIEIAINKARH